MELKDRYFLTWKSWGNIKLLNSFKNKNKLNKTIRQIIPPEQELNNKERMHEKTMKKNTSVKFAMVWMFVSTQNSYVEILTPTVMVIGGEAFGAE